MVHARGKVSWSSTQGEDIAAQQRLGNIAVGFFCEVVVESVVYSLSVAQRGVGWSSSEEGTRNA
jgi:hypothetical protein